MEKIKQPRNVGMANTDFDILGIGKRIRERRLLRGLSGGEFANLAGISSGNLSNIELGRTVPRITTLRLIARALECEIAELLGQR